MGYVAKFKEKFPDKMEPEMIIAYHGSKNKISKFTDEYVGKGNDQEGPGIYFSSSENNARGSGPYVTKASLKLNKVVSRLNPPRRNDIIYMVQHAPDKDDVLQDWAEDPRKAYFMILDSIMEKKNAHACFQSVWYELYRKSPTAYVKNMVKLGYDGVIVPRSEGVTHYVVFNPKAIEIMN